MNKSEFRRLVEQKTVILDGATGTELAKRGMPAGVCPEAFVMEHPETIIDIHNAYFAAGSDIVYIPSFGANRLKLKEFGLDNSVREINCRLAEIAKRNAAGRGWVFGDISPVGEFLKPWGNLEFEELIAIYAEQIAALAEGGADGLAIETMLDLQQTRAALIAAKETAPELPVITTLTFDEHERTLSGNDPLSALITLQSLGADAFGCNCSTGPESMIELIRKIKPYAAVPLVAKPNAGMPKLINDKTVFEMTPDTFGSFADAMHEAGVNIAGGCCGSSPDHIAELAARLKNLPPPPVACTRPGMVTCAAGSVALNDHAGLKIIGERINPTGKKRLQAELRAGSLELVRDFARQQLEQGAKILDVNLGLGGIDEKEMMCRVVDELSTVIIAPLCIDSTDPEVMEAALRRYPGRALVNSISAEKDRIEKLLPVAAKYGAALILLPVADSGIPETLEERISTVEYILGEVLKYDNYTKDDVIVDALVMTIAAGGTPGLTTLGLIEWVTNTLKTGSVAGLSNVSFGLPERGMLNSAFLAMAMAKGLTCVIANPASEQVMNMAAAGDALLGEDENLVRYLGRFTPQSDEPHELATDPVSRIMDLVISGKKESIVEAVEQALASGIEPNVIMDDALIAGINKVGDFFSSGKYFLPQLLMSADAMQLAIARIEPLLMRTEVTEKRQTVVIATVEGDIHDIGKNIVALMLRNYGFKVIDLGKDVPAAAIIDAVKQNKAEFCGLSALMTTTMPRMREVIELARASGLTEVKFIIGGAAVDAHYADEIGAEYAHDAMDTVKICQINVES